MITSALSKRTMSAFYLSIGTSLSFESLFSGSMQPYDLGRVIPQMVDINQYDELWINLFTMFRNIVGSVPSIEVSRLTPEDIGYVLSEEVETIEEILKSNTGGAVLPVFYTSAYADLEKTYKHAKIRTDNTERQKQMTDLLGQTLSVFYKSHKLDKTHRRFKLHLTSEGQSRKKILLLSNYAFDLLSYKAFDRMDLLESHTGILKERAKWHTKYIDGKMLNRLPFNSCFLQVFGDTQTFRPMDKQLRDDILGVAQASNWNPLTTDERVRFTLQNLKNPFFKTIINDMW